MTAYALASSDPRLHPAIIEANLSLFRGERGEARRYLADYAEESGDPHHPLFLWLNAQAQDTPQTRLEHLHVLTSLVSADDPYAQMAQQILDNETRYAALPHPQPIPEKRIFGIPRRLFIGLMAVFALGVVALIIISSLTNTSAETVTGDANATSIPTTQVISPTLLPIHNIPLPPNGYDAQYSAGRLVVMSIEDSSRRVVAPNGDPLTPINGARFYALQVRFECQIGICDTPPQATLALQVDHTLIVAPREGAAIQAQSLLQPIARARSTSGWIIFEIPADSVIDALLITPKDAAQDAPPLSINLGGATR